MWHVSTASQSKGFMLRKSDWLIFPFMLLIWNLNMFAESSFPKVFLLYFPKTFIILHLLLRPVICFNAAFRWRLFFCYGCPITPAPFVEKLVLAPLNWLVSLSKIRWACSWVCCWVPLSCPIDGCVYTHPPHTHSNISIGYYNCNRSWNWVKWVTLLSPLNFFFSYSISFAFPFTF